MDTDDYDEVTLRSLEFVQPKGFGVIYLYTFDDGDMYVGQTTRRLSVRHKYHLKGHIRVDDKLRTHNYTLSILNVVPVEELNDAEIYYIRELNTFEDGLNNTTGGDNFSMSEETRQLISVQKKEYYKNHPEAVEEFNERIRKFWEDPARHEWFINLQNEFWANEENRNKQSEITTNYFANHPEDRKRVSEFFKVFYSDPHNIELMTKRSTDLWKDEEYRRKTLAAQQKYRDEHPEWAENHSRKLKELYRNNPELRKKMSEMQKNLWADDEYRKRMSEARKRIWDTNPSLKKRRSALTKEQMSESSMREKVSNSLKEYHKNHPEAGNVCSARLKKFYQDNPQAREKLSVNSKKNWQDPQFREKLTESRREYWSKDESKQRMSEIKKQYFEEHPEASAAHSKKMKDYYDKHPEKRLEASAKSKEVHKNNPHIRYAKSRKIRNVDTGEVFLSIADAARSCGCNYGTNINKCLKGLRHTAFGYHWEYADE